LKPLSTDLALLHDLRRVSKDRASGFHRRNFFLPGFLERASALWFSSTS
jgi:hypothetical protein